MGHSGGGAAELGEEIPAVAIEVPSYTDFLIHVDPGPGFCPA